MAITDSSTLCRHVLAMNSALSRSVCRIWARNVSFKTPPSHFNNPQGAVPPPYTSSPSLVPDEVISSPTVPTPPPAKPHGKTDSILVDLSLFVAIIGLSYITIDSYHQKMQLDKQITEMKALSMKSLQIQQANFINARNKRDLQILQERRDQNKRDFKMGIHIALLRQQLIENGIQPVDINSSLREFEQNVKADNSIKNVTGQALWLDDNNRMYYFKSFLPQIV